MGSLQERLDRFKKQQEKCQTTLTTIAPRARATRDTPSKNSSSLAPNAKSVVPAVKFSSDTARLQHINNIRKAPDTAKIKRVIDLLLETRKAFTPEQINEACYVDLSTNKAVFDSLKDKLIVHYDGRRFSYKPKHALKNKEELLVLIRKFPDGIAIIDLKDAYPTVMDDLQGYFIMEHLSFKPILTSPHSLENTLKEKTRLSRSTKALRAAGQIWLLSNFDSQEDVAYPNDRGVNIKVDDDLKPVFRNIVLPPDMLDIERELQKNGMKPATNTARPRKRRMKLAREQNSLIAIFPSFSSNNHTDYRTCYGQLST